MQDTLNLFVMNIGQWLSANLGTLNNPDQIIVEIARWLRTEFGNWGVVGFILANLMATVPLIAVFSGCFALTTWLERKGLGRIQNRYGPNRVGPYGLFQPMADGIKMLLKEDIVPERADKIGHFLAPVIIMIPAMTGLVFLPIGRNIIAASIDSALLFFFAIGSIVSLSVFMAGWASHNKFSLVGGMRAIAQLVSYEMPLILSAVVVVMFVGSMNTSVIVEAQQIKSWVTSDAPALQCLGQVLGWHVFQPWGLMGFLLLFVSALAEANRSPFDLPEADSEIIAGHLTEYSGFKYALFFLAEYVNTFAIIGICTTLFLGGWNGPNIRPPWSDDPQALLIPGFVWFFLKIFVLMGIMIWIRGTLPRLRIDQLMGFAWKFLLPLAIINLLVAGCFYHMEWYFGWPFSILILCKSYAIVVRLNKSKLVNSNRTYTYA